MPGPLIRITDLANALREAPVYPSVVGLGSHKGKSESSSSLARHRPGLRAIHDDTPRDEVSQHPEPANPLSIDDSNPYLLTMPAEAIFPL
jgi:hypothetical protein